MKFNSASVLDHIPIEHADDVYKLTSSSCELSNPPKTSSK